MPITPTAEYAHFHRRPFKRQIQDGDRHQAAVAARLSAILDEECAPVDRPNRARPVSSPTKQRTVRGFVTTCRTERLREVL